MSEPNISIVLPIYRQADHIESVVRAYIDALEKVPQRIEFDLIVNGDGDGDGDGDGTGSVCERLEKEIVNVRCFHSSPAGWGMAVRNGIASARGEIICYTNSARTTPAELQLMVIYAVANPESVIKANRKIRESVLRRLGSLVYNLECRSLFDLSNWDINGTPKIFPRKCEALLDLKSTGDIIDLEFNVVCKKSGYLILEVPIFSAVRHGGRSTTNWKSAIRMYKGALKMKRELDSKYVPER